MSLEERPPRSFSSSLIELESKPGSLFRALSVRYLCSGEFVQDGQFQVNSTVSENLDAIKAYGKDQECPRDGERGSALVDVMPDRYANRADVMLSYTWSYSLKTILSALREECRNQAKAEKDVRVWICFININQHRVQSAQTVPFEVFQDEFGSRVQQIQHVWCLATPWHSPLMLERVWCIFEIYTAAASQQGQGKLTIIASEDEGDDFFADISGNQSGPKAADPLNWAFQSLQKVDIARARATVEADQINILRMVRKSSVGEAGVNKVVVNKLSNWFLGIAQKKLRTLFECGDETVFSKVVPVSLLISKMGYGTEAGNFLAEAQEFIERRLTNSRVSNEFLELQNARILCSMGHGARMRWDHHKARSFYKKSLAAFKHLGHHRSDEVIHVHLGWGWAFNEEHEFAEALQQFSLAEEVLTMQCESDHNKGSLAMVCRARAWAHNQMHQSNEALKDLKTAFRLLESRGTANCTSDVPWANACVTMGEVMWTDLKIHSAIGWLTDALEIFQRSGMKSTVQYALALTVLGGILIETGELDQAQNSLQEACEIMRRMNLIEGCWRMTEIHYRFAHLHWARAAALSKAKPYLEPPMDVLRFVSALREPRKQPLSYKGSWWCGASAAILSFSAAIVLCKMAPYMRQ